jgi:hypothetical protein
VEFLSELSCGFWSKLSESNSVLILWFSLKV